MLNFFRKNSKLNLQDYLASLNLKKIPVIGDGNCLFRALAHQLNNSQTYQDIRLGVCFFMLVNAEYFSKFVSNETFEEYLTNMLKDGAWGDNLCIQAFSDIYGVIICIIEIINNEISEIIIEPRVRPMESISHSNYYQNRIIYLLFDGLHYDSLKPIC